MISVDMVKPSARAVLRLIAKSNRVGCSIGKSPGVPSGMRLEFGVAHSPVT
jgi:hypothetical protein